MFPMWRSLWLVVVSYVAFPGKCARPPEEHMAMEPSEQMPLPIRDSRQEGSSALLEKQRVVAALSRSSQQVHSGGPGELISVLSRPTVLLSESMASSKQTFEKHSTLVQTQVELVERQLEQDKKEKKEAEELEKTLAAQVAKIEAGRKAVKDQLAGDMAKASEASEAKIQEGFKSGGGSASRGEPSEEAGDQAPATEGAGLLQQSGWGFALIQQKQVQSPMEDIDNPAEDMAGDSEDEITQVENQKIEVGTAIAYQEHALHRLESNRELIKTMLDATKAEKEEVDRGLKQSILMIQQTSAAAAKAGADVLAEKGGGGGSEDQKEANEELPPPPDEKVLVDDNN